MPWYDGGWRDGDVVPFDVRDRGLLLGDGVFDTAFVLGGRMVWRQAHVDRLLAAARSLGFRIDPVVIDRAIDDVVSRTDRGTIRITVTRGIGPRGLAPPAEVEPMILATAGPAPMRMLFAPLDLHVTTIRRNDTSPTSRIKSLAYLDGILATREALSAGCSDALFLNTRGLVACTSVGNIFALIGNRLVTPPLTDGILDGVVRGVLLRTGGGLDSVERSLSLSDLEDADAVFVTNSLKLLAPVRSIGHKRIQSASLQPIIEHLAQWVRDETGTDPLTLVTQ